MGEAHDAHGVQGLLEVVLVLLPRDGDVPVGQETVAVKALEEQVRWRKTEPFLVFLGGFITSCSVVSLTSEMLSSSSQQAIEDVKGSFILGLSDGPRLLQKV